MKKAFCLAVALLMAFTSTCHAFALEHTCETLDVNLEEQIERIKALEYAELYKQLEAQGALDMIDLFIAELGPRIEMEVCIANNINSEVADVNDYRINYPDGGVLGYRNSIGARVLIMYVLPEVGEQFIIPGEIVTMTAILNFLGSLIPGWLQAFSALLTFPMIMLSEHSASIERADGYAEIMNISDAAGVETATYVRGWSTYPYINVATAGLSDINFESF